VKDCPTISMSATSATVASSVTSKAWVTMSMTASSATVAVSSASRDCPTMSMTAESSTNAASSASCGTAATSMTASSVRVNESDPAWSTTELSRISMPAIAQFCTAGAVIPMVCAPATAAVW
jgi:hypothetical protein